MPHAWGGFPCQRAVQRIDVGDGGAVVPVNPSGANGKSAPTGGAGRSVLVQSPFHGVEAGNGAGGAAPKRGPGTAECAMDGNETTEQEGELLGAGALNGRVTGGSANWGQVGALLGGTAHDEAVRRETLIQKSPYKQGPSGTRWHQTE